MTQNTQNLGKLPMHPAIKSFTIDISTTTRTETMKATQTQRQELYQLTSLARAQRERTARIESIVGNVLMSTLAAFVAYAIAAWLTR
jgi:hypothetical protein